MSIIHFDYLTLQASLTLYLREIYVSGKLLGDGTGSADGPVTGNSLENRTAHSCPVEAVVLPESLIFQGNKGVNSLFVKVLIFNDSPVLTVAYLINLFAVLVINYRRLRNLVIYVRRINLRGCCDNENCGNRKNDYHCPQDCEGVSDGLLHAEQPRLVLNGFSFEIDLFATIRIVGLVLHCKQFFESSAWMGDLILEVLEFLAVSGVFFAFFRRRRVLVLVMSSPSGVAAFIFSAELCIYSLQKIIVIGTY